MKPEHENSDNQGSRVPNIVAKPARLATEGLFQIDALPSVPRFVRSLLINFVPDRLSARKKSWRHSEG
jgi:hypothetical protein